MSSFFTTPASQKKRKRDDATAAPSAKKKRITTNGSSSKPQSRQSAKAARDESISGSGSEDDEAPPRASDEDLASSSESGSEGETGAQRRLRLAEQYLENIKGEVKTVGFDAEEIDRDLIAERLKEDVVCFFAQNPLLHNPCLILPEGSDKRKIIPSHSLLLRLLRRP